MNETSEPDRQQEPDKTDPGQEEPAATESTTPASMADERQDTAESTSTPEPVAVPPTRRSGGRGVAIFALLLALAAVAGAGYSIWLHRMTIVGADSARADLAGEISGIRNRSETLRDDVQSLVRDVEQIRERGSGLDTGLSQVERRLTVTESAMARIETRGQTTADQQWERKEIEHLLRIANHQLSLGHDVDTALAALLAADQVTAAVGDPALLPVRRQLADDIVALRAVEQPDTEGLALRLASLGRRVSDLPVSGQPRALDDGAPVQTADSGFARLRRKVSEFLAGIFKVRRSSGDAGPLLSPEQSFFLRRHLELELQAARAALLSGDAPMYRASIGAARRWTEQYFDSDDPSVDSFVDALRELENRRISVDYPDISGSLRALVETTRAGQTAQ